jgi:hypothetical protein
MRREDSVDAVARPLAILLLLAAVALTGCASRAADERRARAALVKRLEAAVTARARAQVAAGVFQGPVIRTECAPRVGTNQTDLTARRGRYRCLAITFETKQNYSAQPYLATVNYRRGTFKFHRYKIPLYLGV